jgi:hypothetical protein
MSAKAAERSPILRQSGVLFSEMSSWESIHRDRACCRRTCIAFKNKNLFRSAALADATRHAADLCPVITPPESGWEAKVAMKAPVAAAVGKKASPSGTDRDTLWSVTRGTCRLQPLDHQFLVLRALR